MIRRKNIKPVLLVVSLILAVTAVVGGTVAFLHMTTEDVVNTFEPTRVPIEVEEDFDGTVKKQVQIQNHGNIPAYIRVKVLINWIDDSGNIVIADGLPEESAVLSGRDDRWVKCEDGYYYHTEPVAAGALTSYLIGENGYTYPENAPYKLQVEFLAQSIQAEPKSVVTTVWGVDPTTLKED